MLKHLDIKAAGRVQGVFFRLAAKEKALALGLSGFARNETDGGVLIEAEGEEKALASFVAWCRVGPELSTVKGLEVKEGGWQGHRGFKVF